MIEIWQPTEPPTAPQKQPRTHIQHKAFMAGVRGEPATVNPHPRGTAEWDQWLRDWESGQDARRHREFDR